MAINDQISIIFIDLNLRIDNWTSYSFDSDFFTPTDSFTFTLGDDRVDQLVDKIKIGSKLQLVINESIQCVGRIDKIDFNYSRNGGTILTLTGRDLLGIVCDATINPTIQSAIKPATTYKEFFRIVFGDFGYTIDDIIELDTGFDATLASGGKAGQVNQKNIGGKRRTRLRTLQASQLKPYKNEGYMQYAMRLCARNGWTIKSSVDGKKVNIFSPSYDRTTPTQYNLIHEFNGTNNNILSAKLDVDWSRQPSIIIAEAIVGGGVFRENAAQCIYANEITAYDENQNLVERANQIIGQYNKGFNTNLPQDKKNPNAPTKSTYSATKLIEPNTKLQSILPAILFKVNVPNSSDQQVIQRTKFVYDQDSRTPEDIEFYVRETMYKMQSTFLTLMVEVQGHTDLQTGTIYAINNLINIKDDTLKINGPMWIQKRTFTKSRGGGTKTLLELKLPYIWNYIYDDSQ